MAIIIKPIVTEKMTAMADKLNRYGFAVCPDANKQQIKKAVEEMYNVTKAFLYDAVLPTIKPAFV